MWEELNFCLIGFLMSLALELKYFANEKGKFKKVMSKKLLQNIEICDFL